MTYEHNIGDIPFVIEYDYHEHNGRKFPKIKTILLNTQIDDYKDNSWDLTEIIEYSLVEQIKSSIFKELNGDIHNK